MMNPTSKNPAYELTPGTSVRGKWHGQTYRVIKKIGSGATGTVYLVACRQGHGALKISENGMSITSEVNVLKKFSRVQGQPLGPSLLDVDDWQAGKGDAYPFYVMEYIQGTGFFPFIRAKGMEWVPILMMQLLGHLQFLHDNGWVFGDLKPENTVITMNPPRLRLIDVGGTTLIGRSIKEYTEFFDRGYWGLGSRRAEPSYDLFSAAMFFVNTAYPARLTRKEGGIAQLQPLIMNHAELSPYAGVLLKALEGKYGSANEMKGDLIETAKKKEAKGGRHSFSSSPGSRTGRKSVSGKTKTKKKSPARKKTFLGHMFETVLLFILIFVVYFLYLMV
ncbi:protein kinase domain-containing protein [Bacillus marinisedimentorum]|uniref:protein kinase domain-containing protein n=1 Tax=Bacillus marinisedimentorum TaxID=1821260 RepID=UPI000872CB48|nr:hypothetical protein [Bacillus marinisedimentorum]